MKQGQIEIRNITEGVIWKKLLRYFFPLLFGAFFQQLYNTTDAIVVGRYVSKEALSAVGGATGTIINLLVGFFMGLATGATVTISQFYGGNHKDKVSKAVHTAIALAISGGTVIMIIGIIIAPVALKAMGTPDDIMSYAVTYIRIYFAGMIVNMLYNMGAGILRAIGDSKRPLYFLIASCFLNIVLDILFVIVFKWGVAGVAIATILSQLCSACLVCMILLRTNECYQLNIKKIRFHKILLIKMVRIGLPAGFQSIMYNITNILIQKNINSFGTDIVAAWTAYGKIDGIFWMIMGCFGISITTFVGQNYGARKNDRVRRGIKICFLMAMFTAISLSIILYFWGSYVLRLFSNDEAVIEKGIEILHFLVPFYFTYVSIEILSGSLRGMGNAFIPMILTCLGVCVLRITWIVVAVPIWHDIKTVIFSYPLAWGTTSLLYIIYYNYFIRKQRIR